MENYYDFLEEIVDKYLKEDYFSGEVFGDFAFKRDEVLKGLKIAYLQGVLHYHVPLEYNSLWYPRELEKVINNK